MSNGHQKVTCSPICGFQIRPAVMIRVPKNKKMLPEQTDFAVWALTYNAAVIVKLKHCCADTNLRSFLSV